MKLTLKAALSDFQRSRSSEITPLIIELGRQAATEYRPPEAKTNMFFHRAWLDAVKSADARTWALSTLTAQLPKLADGQEARFGDQSEALTQRLRALEALDPDPRISTALLALAELNPPIVGFFDVMVAMADALLKHADDTTEAAIPADFFVAGGDFDPKKLVFPRKVAGSSADAKVLASRRSKARAPELWRAVYDRPDDDTPREVLCDFLQEQADPRGEFIALQLHEARGRASADDSARAQALLKQHGKQWLGALRPCVGRAEFRRGFLFRLELAGSWASRRWEEHARDPSLATVEELRSGQCVSKLVALFLRSGVMKNLRVAPAHDELMLEALRASAAPPCLAELSGVDESTTALQYFEQTPHLVALSWAGLNVVTALKKWSPAMRLRLRRLSCDDNVSKAKALWALLPSLEELEMGFLLKIALYRWDATVARVTAEGMAYGTLKGLPKSVKRVEFTGSRALYQRLAKAHPRVKLEFRPPPSGLITNPKG